MIQSPLVENTNKTIVHSVGEQKQRPQPPICCSDICVKSESNHECLSKSLSRNKINNAHKCNETRFVTKARNHQVAQFMTEMHTFVH